MDALASPPGAEAVYRHRMHAFVAERTYWLTDDALAWRDDQMGDGRLPYRDVARVQAYFHPSRAQTNKYHLRLTARHGGRVELTNTSYKGFANFAEHNAEYTDFVRRLHEKLARFGHDISFEKGAGMISYAGNALLSVFIVAVVIWVLWFLLAVGLPWVALIKLMIILYFLPTLWRWIRNNRPQRYDPVAIPEGALPRA